MSLYVLDTDTLSLFQHNHPVVLHHVRAVSPSDRAVTIITVEEQLRGWFTSLRQATRPDHVARAYESFAESVRFLVGLQLLSFSLNSVQRFNSLVALKLNIGKMDLRIAAIALEHGAVVVTRNARDFGRVPNLTIEDWTV
jgi:tRNA(fMet)-specific endonuclease VapC